MVLKNKKGSQKEVNLLYKIEINSQDYLVYEDEETHSIYAGIYEKNKLNSLSDKEIIELEEIVERIEGWSNEKKN